jgi:preprotein translocase subunit YajC
MTNPLGVPLLLLQAGGGSAVSGFAFELLAMVAIIYFIMWRPQQKARRQREDRLRALKRGDEVVTAGGIVGEVVHIRESAKDGGGNRMDDRITIKSGESRLIVTRGRIDQVIGTTAVTPATNNPAT